MSTYNIPKKSRNKYGYVKNVTGNNYITTQQMMATSGAGGGAGGGTVINSQVAVAIGHQVNEKTNQAKEESYTYIGYTLSQLSYVTLPELQAMSYITQTELSLNTYVTQAYVTNECSEIKTECYNYAYNLTTASILSCYSYSIDLKDACYTYAYNLSAHTENDINSSKASSYEKAEEESRIAKTDSYNYTDASVNTLKSEISNTLSYFAWPVSITSTDYSVKDMAVGEMRPVFVNSSSTINLTMPGDSTQNYIILAMNVLVAALVGAGKTPRYITAAGGSSTSISWTSSAEPYMLILVLRLS